MKTSDNYKFELFNHVNNGVMVLDEECRVLFWNNWLYLHTGVCVDEISRKELVEIFPDVNLKKLKRKMNQTKMMKAPAYYQGFNDRYLIPVQVKSLTGQFYDVMQQDVTVSYLEDEDVYLVTVYDCTPYLEVEQKLNRMAEINKKHSQSKSEFLAHTSHELRTPLNSILGFIELLKSTSLSVEQREYLNVLQDSSNSMLDIVNSVMSISEVEKGVLEFKPTECSIHDTVKSSAELFYAKALQKSIRLVCFIDPELPAKVFADSSKIRQILLNFISNAVKFTPEEGEVYVKAELVSAETGVAEIKFSVKDNGAGMNKEFTDKIFMPYEREQTDEYFEGSGVGLYICSKFAELMQTEIKVESAVNEGSEFSFVIKSKILDGRSFAYAERSGDLAVSVVLKEDKGAVTETLSKYMQSLGMPNKVFKKFSDIIEENAKGRRFSAVNVIAECDELCKDATLLEKMGDMKIVCLSDTHCETHRNNAHGDKLVTYRGILDPRSFLLAVKEAYKKDPAGRIDTNKRVLVMEDNYNNQLLMKVIFEKLGAATDIVSNGESGLMYFKQHKYDLVLIDINMPIKDGLETMTAIKEYAEKENADIPPVYALTAHALKEKQVEYLSYGFDGYLVKPISVSVIKQLLDVAAPVEHTVSAISPSGMIEYIMLNMLENAEIESEDVERLLDIFFKSIYNDLDELEYNVKNELHAKIKSKAHYIKGQFLSFYLKDMAASMEKLEEHGLDIGIEYALQLVGGIRKNVKGLSEQLAVFRESN
jgi:signal transduction histidine kinase/DNA-binding NarL/FixJ family response regulator